MPRRIDIELTSAKDDGTWTWRAAGAREPRGTVPGALVGTAAKVGDVLKVDAEFFVDGIQITGLVPDKGPRPEPERLEILGSGRDEEPLVTTVLARGDRPRDGDRRDRRERRDGDRRDRPPRRDRRDGERSERPAGADGGDARPSSPGAADRRDRDRDRRGGDQGERQRRSRPARPEPPPIPVVERPKPKRLRPGRVHRTALLEALPEEQRPIAEQVVLGGLPAVRQAIEKQNAERTAGGEPAIAAGPLLEMAEKLVPRVRAAEWRDRAEAAQKDLEVLDLRDLRSVVSAADSGPRDDEARELARTLKEGLAARVDAEHASWLEELTATVDVGRIVRALRLSSRPPKAGAPLPPDLATKLVAGSSEALTADAAPERWVAVLEALAFAPVRDKVIPASLPTDLHDDVRATIARLAARIPKIAHIFEIEPDRDAPRPERRRPGKPPRPPKPDQAKADKPRRPKPDADQPSDATETAPAETPEAKVDAEEPTPPEATAEPEPVADAPVVDQTPPEPEPTPEAQIAEVPAEPEPEPTVGEEPAVSPEATVSEDEPEGASTPEA